MSPEANGFVQKQMQNIHSTKRKNHKRLYDNIVVYSASQEKHNQTLRKVL